MYTSTLPRVQLDGSAVSASARIEVHDSGGGTPRIPDARDEGGRGLLLVAALSDSWGVGKRDPGKVVWAEFGRQAERPPERYRSGGRSDGQRTARRP